MDIPSARAHLAVAERVLSNNLAALAYVYIGYSSAALFANEITEGLRVSKQAMEMAEQLWGLERCATAYAWRSLKESGAVLAFGSDAPVEPLNPWLRTALITPNFLRLALPALKAELERMLSMWSS